MKCVFPDISAHFLSSPPLPEKKPQAAAIYTNPEKTTNRQHFIPTPHTATLAEHLELEHVADHLRQNGTREEDNVALLAQQLDGVLGRKLVNPLIVGVLDTPRMVIDSGPRPSVLAHQTSQGEWY